MCGGIKLAIESRNKPIVQAAINFAGELFNQNHYKDNATRQKLADLLLPFLNQADFDLRNLAAEKLNDKKNQYDVSNRFIDQNNRAKVAVIDTDWKRAISLGDLAISILRQAVGGTLRIEQTENLNVNCQISAVKAIDKILTAVSRKVSTLSPYLQHDDDEVRQEVANLLQPIQSHLDMASTQILTALLFTMNLPYNSNINSLDKSTVESCLRNIENHKQNIRDIFEKATSACANNSTSTRNFLSKQKEFLLNRVSIYSSNLNIILKKFTTEFDIQKICEKIDRNHSLKGCDLDVIPS